MHFTKILKAILLKCIIFLNAVVYLNASQNIGASVTLRKLLSVGAKRNVHIANGNERLPFIPNGNQKKGTLPYYSNILFPTFFESLPASPIVHRAVSSTSFENLDDTKSLKTKPTKLESEAKKLNNEKQESTNYSQRQVSSAFKKSTISKQSNEPHCATKGKTFCEDFENYPQEFIDKMLVEKNVSRLGFGKDIIQNPLEARRFTGEFEMCSSEIRIVFPKIGKTGNDEWKLIINQDNLEGGYVQGVTIEICKKEGEQCALSSKLPFYYKTTCKQKYVYRRLISVTDGSPIEEMFLLPSACSCSYTKVPMFHLNKNFNFMRFA